MTRTVTPNIQLLAIYTCNNCGEEHHLFPPTGSPEPCVNEDCRGTEFTFAGMFLWESFKYEDPGKEPYYLAEPWMDTPGIPICHFCMNRDFEPDYDILEHWLCPSKSGEPFHYNCVCKECQEKHGFKPVTRAKLDEQTNGLFSEAEQIAEDHNAVLEAQYANDLLNYGQDYVNREYHGVYDEEYEDDEDGDFD